MNRRRELRAARRWLYVWALIAAPVLYGMSFPLWRLAWVAWIGLIPWCVALRVARTRTALVVGCASTLLGSYVCTTWLPRAVATYYQQPLALGLLLFAGVYLATIGPYIIAFTLCYRRLARRPSAWLPLLTGAAWTAAELGRVRLLVGDPFGLFGYSQVDMRLLIQVADVTGVYGMSFILIAMNAALAEVWLAYTHESDASGRVAVCTPTQAWRGVGLVAVTLAVMIGYGADRLWTLDRGSETPATRIALVQGNLDLGSQWRQEFYGRNLETYMRLTWDVLQSERPQLVFWPESAMTFFLADEPLYRAAIGRVLTPMHTELIAGGPREEHLTTERRYYNSGFVISPDGSIVAAYDKQQLLPFAEYFPFGGVELLRREFARVREFTPGGPARTLPTVAGPAGILICNEAMFGEIASDRVRGGASYLVTLANDSWLGDRKFAEQAFDMARMRAVEQRRYLVRASTSGPSAIVDPLGRVVARTEDDTRATIAGSIYPRTGVTFYARFGDAFGVCCAALPLMVIIKESVRQRRRRYAVIRSSGSVVSSAPLRSREIDDKAAGSGA